VKLLQGCFQWVLGQAGGSDAHGRKTKGKAREEEQRLKHREDRRVGAAGPP